MKKLTVTILFLFTTVSLKAADVRHVNNDGDGFRVLNQMLLGDATIEHANATHDPVYLSGQIGLDDLSSSGTYTQTDNAFFQIRIESTGATDDFEWRKGTIGAWTGPVAMSGGAQLLQDGISITWAATTGHTLADEWEMFVGHMVHFSEAVHINADLATDGDVVVAGVLRSLSPLKVAGGIDLLSEAKLSTNLTKMDFMVGSSTPLTLNEDGTVKVNGNSLSVSRSFIPITDSTRAAFNFGGGGSLVGATADTDALILQNAYYNSGYKYLTTDLASAIKLDDGVITLSTTISGTAGDAITWKDVIEIAVGKVFINETSNAKMTEGLTINQGANDNEILALKSSDVVHSMTNLTESDTYFSLKKLDASSGGVNIRGLSDADHPGLVFQGVMGTANPTNSNPAIKFQGMKYNGATGAGGLADDETVLAIQNGGTTAFFISGDGHASAKGFGGQFWDVAGGHFENAIVGVEYYSPDQQGGAYGTIYRQYFTTSLPADLTSGTNVSRLVDYYMNFTYAGGTLRGAARGSTTGYGTDAYRALITLSGSSGDGDLALDVNTYTLIDGWVDYCK